MSIIYERNLTGSLSRSIDSYPGRFQGCYQVPTDNIHGNQILLSPNKFIRPTVAKTSFSQTAMPNLKGIKYALSLGETRYRCILWCYGGMLPNSFTLIKQKENAEMTREEIHSIRGLYGTFRTPVELSEVLCLFKFSHFF